MLATFTSLFIIAVLYIVLRRLSWDNIADPHPDEDPETGEPLHRKNFYKNVDAAHDHGTGTFPDGYHEYEIYECNSGEVLCHMHDRYLAGYLAHSWSEDDKVLGRSYRVRPMPIRVEEFPNG